MTDLRPTETEVVDDAPVADEWYRDAVVYELHVRAFQDSDGDGIGDFRGLTSRLDYLADLGVTAIWLLPFYPSPLRDDGYDIADYTAIHPDYGTMEDFREFVDEAHARGLKVITELVINHTSDQHPWFRRAVADEPGGRWRDWYVWSDTADRYADVRVIFQDFEVSNWTWSGDAGQYYWHRFYHHQPDLNFDNPEVRQAVKDVLDFWAAAGVDGMRLDAIPYLFEREGTNGENLPETHAFLKELRAHLDRWPGRMFLAEANQWPEDAAAYFGDGDECQMNFHFPLMPRLFMAVAQEDRFPVLDILQQTPDIPAGAQWGIFLRNHDELTLEMVTDEERDYMYRAYARDRQMRVNLGIRRRLAPLLRNDRRLIELMMSLLLSLPGTPILYYGDEIGMGDNVHLGDRNGVRTPMQWSADANAGFSRANPQSLFLPAIIDPEYHFQTINVDTQRDNQRSLWWWVKRTLALRQRMNVFGRGDTRFLTPENGKVLAFLRELDDERVLVVANLSRHAQPVELDLAGLDAVGASPVELVGRASFPPVGPHPYPLSLAPYQVLWLGLEDDPSRTTRSKVPGRADPAAARLRAPEVKVADVTDVRLDGSDGRALGAAVPAMLVRQRWFGGKSRQVRRTSISDVVGLDVPRAALLVATVEYVEGEADRYLLPVRVVDRDDDEPGVLARLVDAAGNRAQLIDAVGEDAVARELLRLVLGGQRTGRPGAGLVGEPAEPGADVPDVSELHVNPLRTEQSNSSVLFGQDHLLKVLRRLETGENPDVEVTAHLGDFPHVPRLVGALRLRPTRGTGDVVAVLQEFVPNEGDLWRHTLDELDRFVEGVLVDPPADGRPAPASAPRALLLAGAAIPEQAHTIIGPYLERARLLGTRIGELHVALADAGGDPDFRPEPFTLLWQRSLYQSVRNGVRRGLASARRASRRLDDPDTAAEVMAVCDTETELLSQLRALVDTPIRAARIRVHGDLHLGQVLWTGRDAVIIDFEGEPARPLSERRLKRSPLRDVAGMLRSFQYATAAARREQLQQLLEPDTPELARVERWLEWWQRWVSAAFLRGWLQASEGQAYLPRQIEHTAILLDAFLLEKAVYELGYELDNRPGWVDIPLAGIRAVLAGDDGLEAHPDDGDQR